MSSNGAAAASSCCCCSCPRGIGGRVCPCLRRQLLPVPAAVSSAQLTPADVEVCDVVEAAREGRRPMDYVVREVQARLGAALHRWAGRDG